MSRTAYLRASSNAGAFRLPSNVTSIRCPTLVVAGQREHPLIHQSLAAVVAAMSAAQARVAPGVGHGWNGETPDLFARTVRAWISDSPLPVELLPFAAEQPLTAHNA